MQRGMPNSLDRRRPQPARAEAPVIVPEASAQRGPAFKLDLQRSLQMHPVLAGSVAAAVFVVLVIWALGRKPVYTAESLIYVEPLEVRVLNDGSGSGYDPSRYDSYLQQQIQTVERADTLEAALKKVPPGLWRFPGESTAAAVKRLGGSLKVERVLNSYQVAIDVTSGDPEGAAAAANAVTAAYLEKGRSDEHARADQRLQLLLEEKQRISDELARDKSEQVTLGRSLGVANPSGATGNPYDLQSEGLRSQLAAAHEARDAVEAQLASVSGGNGAGLQTAANEVILGDAGLISIKQTLSQRRAVLSDQMAGLTAANPVYKQDLEEIAAIDRAIERATADARQRAERQLQDKLRLDLRRTADVESRLNAQLAQQTARATGAGPKLQRAAELETDLQRLNTRFATVDDAIRGLQLETGGPGQAHLALSAQAPDVAQPSRSRLVLLLALPLALLCGAAAAVIARRLDKKIYLAGDVQEVLGFQPMGVLPNPSEVGPAAYEEFLLRLAGGLEGALEHGNARIFVFTSVSIAQREAAWLTKLCGKLHQLGFRAVCIRAEELLPAGEHGLQRVRGEERAGLKRLRDLLDECDFVLISAAPLLGSAITEYVVRCADATILLVESTATDKRDLRRAALLLEHLNPQGIGAVLEDMPMRYADQVFRAAVRTARYSPFAQEAAEEDSASSPLPKFPVLTGREEMSTLHEAVMNPRSPEEQTMTTQASDTTIQAKESEAGGRGAGTEPREEFVPIPTTFKTLAFSGPESAKVSHVLRAHASADVSSAAHRLETPAFETEKFRTTLDRESAALLSESSRSEPLKAKQEDRREVTPAPSAVAAVAETATVIKARDRVEEEPNEPAAVATSEESPSAAAHETVWRVEPEAALDEREAEKPTSWYRRLVRFSENPAAESETRRSEASLLEDPALVLEEQVSPLASHGVERPVEFIFRESARPVAVFAPKAPPVEADAEKERKKAVEEVSTESSRSERAEPSETAETIGEKEALEASAVEEDGAKAHAATHEPETSTAADEREMPVDETPLAEPEAAGMAPEDVKETVEREVEQPEYPRARPLVAELPKEPPMASTSRPRMMPPITMEAIPSLITTLSMGKHKQESAEILPPAKPPLSEKPAPPVLNVAEGAARYRPGLARAVRYATLDDGPPARASEGLTAMRHGAREVEKTVHEVTREVSSPPPAQPPDSSGMSRRWGMLSRFERSDASSESGDEVLAATGTKGRSTESGS